MINGLLILSVLLCLTAAHADRHDDRHDGGHLRSSRFLATKFEDFMSRCTTSLLSSVETDNLISQNDFTVFVQEYSDNDNSTDNLDFNSLPLQSQLAFVNWMCPSDELLTELFPTPRADCLNNVKVNIKGQPFGVDVSNVTDPAVVEEGVTDICSTMAFLLLDPTVSPSQAPTTNAPITNAPITSAPITNAPITSAPITSAPTTNAPITSAPITNAPITNVPTTNAPITNVPTTNAPTTNAPITNVPTATPTVTFTTPSPTIPTTQAPQNNSSSDDDSDITDATGGGTVNSTEPTGGSVGAGVITGIALSAVILVIFTLFFAQRKRISHREDDDTATNFAITKNHHSDSHAVVAISDGDSEHSLDSGVPDNDSLNAFLTESTSSLAMDTVVLSTPSSFNSNSSTEDYMADTGSMGYSESEDDSSVTSTTKTNSDTPNINYTTSDSNNNSLTRIDSKNIILVDATSKKLSQFDPKAASAGAASIALFRKNDDDDMEDDDDDDVLELLNVNRNAPVAATAAAATTSSSKTVKSPRSPGGGLADKDSLALVVPLTPLQKKERLDGAIDSGDWLAAYSFASGLAASQSSSGIRNPETPSTTGSVRSKSTTRSASLSTYDAERAELLDDLVEAGDWNAVANLAAGFSTDPEGAAGIGLSNNTRNTNSNNGNRLPKKRTLMDIFKGKGRKSNQVQAVYDNSMSDGDITDDNATDSELASINGRIGARPLGVDDIHATALGPLADPDTSMSASSLEGDFGVSPAPDAAKNNKNWKNILGISKREQENYHMMMDSSQGTSSDVESSTVDYNNETPDTSFVATPMSKTSPTADPRGGLFDTPLESSFVTPAAATKSLKQYSPVSSARSSPIDNADLTKNFEELIEANDWKGLARLAGREEHPSEDDDDIASPEQITLRPVEVNGKKKKIFKAKKSDKGAKKLIPFWEKVIRHKEKEEAKKEAKNSALGDLVGEGSDAGDSDSDIFTTASASFDVPISN